MVTLMKPFLALALVLATAVTPAYAFGPDLSTLIPDFSFPDPAPATTPPNATSADG